MTEFRNGTGVIEMEDDNNSLVPISPSNFDVDDFTGTFVNNDGSNNFTVGVGTGIENDGSGNIQTEEKGSFNPGMTQWADGLSNEEIGRIQLQSGEILQVERLEFRQKGGGSSSSASVNVYDSTASSEIVSQNLGGTSKDGGSSGTGNLVVIRLNNSTGGGIEAVPIVHYRIKGA